MSLEALKIVSNVVIDHQQCSSEKDKIKKELAEKSSVLLEAKEENQELAVYLAQCTDRLENSTKLIEQGKEQINKLKKSEKVAAKLKQMCDDFIVKNKQLEEQLNLFQDVETKHTELLSQMEDYVALKGRVVELEKLVVQLGEENKTTKKLVIQLEEEMKAERKQMVQLGERIKR